VERGAQQLFGYSAAEMQGQHAAAVSDDDGDGAGRTGGAGRWRHSTTAEVQRRTKSGELIWVQLDLRLRLDDSGEAMGMEVRARKLADVLSPADS
jgi:PAS domain S-box-containing protein